MTGKIFSIEEFSTYDGPGIRMTVFMKGCPLRCMWCHNPEGQRFESEMLHTQNGCLHCGACLAVGERVTGKPCLVPESVAVCPRGLLRVCGDDLTPEQLVEKLEKNFDILNSSGGGITFSGGEPLSQYGFVKECLTLLKGKTGRALQTCGFCDSDKFMNVLEDCDFVLYDLKHMNSEIHKHYTGVGNELILENYRLLAKSGKPMVTRIPLIPSVNDTEENIRSTAEFMKDNGKDYIELLPYNKLAGAKYASVGREYDVDFDATRVPDTHEDIFAEYGISVKVY